MTTARDRVLVNRILTANLAHGVAYSAPNIDSVQCLCGLILTDWQSHERHRAESVADALDLTRVWASVETAPDGTTVARWNEICDDRDQCVKAAHDERLAVGVAYLSAWKAEGIPAVPPSNA